MATDQPTDATAARLSEEFWNAIDVSYLTPGTENYDELWRGKCDAALDTLIRYHRAAGAVEALEAVPCAGSGYCASYSLVDDRCKRCRLLAAAQERLAAYAKETA